MLSRTLTQSRFLSVVAASIVAGAVLTGCSSTDPLESGDDAPPGEAIVVGSQDYYSNEIIAEIYAQALEAEGIEVDRQFRIGQREVYLPELEAGSIDLFPEYTGNLLQYWDPETDARQSEIVYEELRDATPSGLRVLAQSPATDQDSYVVTRDFADTWRLAEIGDLSGVDTSLTLGANSEAETRPYGPAGLAAEYGVEGVAFTPIEDGGGPLTVKALEDGDIQLAILYSADPTLAESDLVSLQDPRGLFLASHVVPLASDRVDDEAAAIIDRVSAAMSAEDLIALNARSVGEELSAEQIAADWLSGLD